jgi:hypothetical protein
LNKFEYRSNEVLTALKSHLKTVSEGRQASVRWSISVSTAFAASVLALQRVQQLASLHALANQQASYQHDDERLAAVQQPLLPTAGQQLRCCCQATWVHMNKTLW